MIKQVQLKNFRCFRDTTVDLEPFTVLIGKNDTGKTSLLDALGYVANAHGAYGRPFDSRLDVMWGEADESMELKVVFQQSLLDANKQEVIQFRKAGNSFGWHTTAPVPHLDRMMRYSLSVNRLKAGHSVGGRFGSLPMSPDGEGLPAVLDRILSEHTEVFEVISKELSDRIPQIKKLRLRPVTETNYKIVGFDLRSGARIDATQVSDGVMLLLAFLTIVHDECSPPVLLVEEPENGIHPKQLREVLRLLYSLTQREEDPIQVILTTHSPYVLDFVPANSIRVFRRDSESGDVEVLPFAEVAPIKEMLEGGLTPGEAWYNSDEDEFKEVLDAGIRGQ